MMRGIQEEESRMRSEDWSGEGRRHGDVCPDHSGIFARIKSLEARGERWDSALESVVNKINVILGSVLVCALGIIGNLIVRIVR